MLSTVALTGHIFTSQKRTLNSVIVLMQNRETAHYNFMRNGTFFRPVGEVPKICDYSDASLTRTTQVVSTLDCVYTWRFSRTKLRLGR